MWIRLWLVPTQYYSVYIDKSIQLYRYISRNSFVAKNYDLSESTENRNIVHFRKFGETFWFVSRKKDVYE